jgi:hypothetical protein
MSDQISSEKGNRLQHCIYLILHETQHEEIRTGLYVFAQFWDDTPFKYVSFMTNIQKAQINGTNSS